MTTISYIHQEKKNFTLRVTARGSRYKIAKLQIHLYMGPFNYYVRTWVWVGGSENDNFFWDDISIGIVRPKTYLRNI